MRKLSKPDLPRGTRLFGSRVRILMPILSGLSSLLPTCRYAIAMAALDACL